MDLRAVEDWMGGYRDAWERRDADAAARLFTHNATYRWGPFEEPLRGREAIRSRWQEATSGQNDVRFGSEVLAVTDERAIVRWWVSLLRCSDPPRRSDLEGIFDLTLTADGLCRRFREWWNGRESPA